MTLAGILAQSNVAVSIAGQLRKMLVPKEVGPFGMVISVRPIQPLKASLLIVLTDDGISIDVSNGILQNA